ncbi:hypothetical protein ACHAQJ_002309 [Trichoderma viride]
MAVQFLNASSNSTIFTSNGTVTSEQLSEVAALLPAIAFAFLPPQFSHGTILWSSYLNAFSYFINSIYWLYGAPYMHLSYWVICVTILSLILGSVVISSHSYRDIKPENVSLSGYTVCGLIAIHFVRLGGYFITFEHLLTWKNIALILIWCTTIIVVIPAIFIFISPPISTFFSQLVARRIRWIFWLYQDDIQANTKDKVEGYTQVDTPCDSDDDTIYELTGVKIDSTKDDAEDDTGDDAGDDSGDEAEQDGKSSTQKGAEQHPGQDNQDTAQNAEQGTEQGTEPNPQQDTKREIETEDPPPCGMILLIFLWISAPALLVFEHIGLR